MVNNNSEQDSISVCLYVHADIALWGHFPRNSVCWVDTKRGEGLACLGDGSGCQQSLLNSNILVLHFWF